MSKDNPISDNPCLPVFRREDWIDAKRKWGTNLPSHVQDACNQAFSVPSAVIERHIPTDEMPPIELLKGTYPTQRSAYNTYKVEAWFSRDQPDGSFTTYLSRQIPNSDVLKKLYNYRGQAWLNGNQSIVDPSYNNGKDHLPLWILKFWKAMLEVSKGYTMWQKAERCIAAQPEETVRELDEEVFRAFGGAREMLSSIGWRSSVPGSSGLTTLEFAKLLKGDWISDRIVQQMATELSRRLRLLKPDSKILIAGPKLAESLKSAAHQKVKYSQRTTPLLSRYEAHRNSKKMDELYFPAHVDGNHWISLHVDFRNRTYSYGEFRIYNLRNRTDNHPAGDSRGGTPKKLLTALHQWLMSQFGKDWTNAG